jgi:hypothetical protein
LCDGCRARYARQQRQQVPQPRQPQPRPGVAFVPAVEFASEAELLRATVGLYRRRRPLTGERLEMPDAYAAALDAKRQAEAGR